MNIHKRSAEDIDGVADQETIIVTATLVYYCESTFSLDRQADQIYGDMHGLLAPTPASRVDCKTLSVTYAISETDEDVQQNLGTRQAARVEAALAGLAYPESSDDSQIILRNALTDLRHFADQKGLSFSVEDRVAQENYTQEVYEVSA